MSQDDEIRIDLKSDVSEADRARAKLAELERQADDLRGSFSRGNVALEVYNKELKSIERQANATRAALDKVEPGKLTGQRRSSAIFQAGLAGANIAQDVAAAGPAAGVNNLLGLAGNNGVRALAGEAVAAAGGIGTVVTAFGALSVAAGAAFLTIRHDLKEAKLEWSDFGDVVGNTTPVRMASEAFEGLGKLIESTKGTAGGEFVGSILKSIYDGAGGTVIEVGKLVTGWDEATAAAKRHKDEVQAGVQAAKEYADAVKAFSKARSPEQDENDRRAELFRGEVARLGGAGGVDAVARRLAEKATASGADDKVKATEFGEDGKPHEVEITRREKARRDALDSLNRAAKGDPTALGAMLPRLRAAGYDTDGLGLALKGVDREGDEKRAKEENDQLDKTEPGRRAKMERARAKRREDAEKAAEKQAREADAQSKQFEAQYERQKEQQKKAAIEKGEKATAGTAVDARYNLTLMRHALATGTLGNDSQAVKTLADEMRQRNPEMTEREANQAAADKIGKLSARLGDEINEKAMHPDMKAAERIGVGDFARSVESQGLMDINKQMLEQLVEIARKTSPYGILAP